MPNVRNTLGQFISGPSFVGNKTYHSWNSMRGRCLFPTTNGYENYGGRGITICERWDSFANFLEDMGERPEGMTLDRIDVNGNYEPGNCKWSTLGEQRQNRRFKIYICKRGHSITGENVYQYFSPSQQRVNRTCRTCRDIRNAARPKR